MTDDASNERDPVDLLVEEFLRRHRAGERVDVEAFAAAHGEHAEQLRELLPMLQALEQVKRDRESTSGLGARLALPALERLGDFRIVTEVGRGGMGVVFEAVQETLGRKVALKVLPQASLLTGNQLERFQREAQIAARLHHSNIVPVFGSGETDGYHWYAMQFIAGAGLDSWRASAAQQPPDSSAEWRSRARFVATVGEQIASALAYAHGHGTLHRDIKPANLLLEEGGHVWVTDFGLAKALEAEGLTQTGDMLGTLQYMAPEQFAGEYDARSEVYAVGITLYELLTLRAAYGGATRSELMEAIRRGRPLPLRRVCPELPEDLVILVEKAAAGDPRDRYQSAEALQHDLQAFLEDRPIAARRQSSLGLVVRWCRRNRAMAAFAAATLSAVIGAAVTGWVAYVVTSDALTTVETAGEKLDAERRRAEENLRLSLAAIDDVFDALVGPDPLLMFEEDPDTGEQSVSTLRAVDQQDVALLEQMLAFHDEFAAQNRESGSLRYETARAYRRVGVIHVRLGELEAAAAAYEQALLRYRDVIDRDITRELAAVHVDYGRLELQRGRPREARQRFGHALQLLEQEPPTGDTTALQFERASVHYLLGRYAGLLGRGRPEGDRRGARSGRGRDPRSREQDRERRVEGQRHVDQARSLLAPLLTAHPTSVEFRALDARCLLLSGKLAGREDATRRADADTGLVRLRAVTELPGGDRFRLELADALVDSARRRRGADETPGRLDLLREAKTQTEALVAEYATEVQYQHMRARVGSELGVGLLREARTTAAAARTTLEAEAEAELRVARGHEQVLLAGGDGDFRLLMQTIRTCGQLEQLLRRTGRAAEADAEIEATMTVLRASVEAMKADIERLGPGRREPPAALYWPGLGTEFRQRLDALRELLPRSERPERGDRDERGRGGPPPVRRGP